MKVRLIKTIMTVLLCNGFASHAYAVDYDAGSLDKLFTDRGQRAQIDAARTGNQSAGGAKKISKVKINGYVTRSDGKSVVWVNDKSTLESSKVDNVRVHQSSIGKNKRVVVSSDGKRKQLKPGEVWHKETGKVVEEY